ncbi:hypothetical protein H6G25_06015 [Dolichospermum sp. FACHB-1091]|uniref:hypothetical protein n=1 Tax=Dolichospermum sp. FACHB-1091 TaxID=2692798 RepID=UPI00168102CC|nr:hypothetical protein [Dolichospermum sp. FACHB-1091]MBD2442764.1 hypothetical protein [Dolichospermum sp. FACHB-1091]
MSYQNIKSDLLVELSADQQELLSGGQQRPILCTRYRPHRRRRHQSSASEADIVNIDIDTE